MQNLSISPVALTTLTQWKSYSTSFFNRLTNLHQIEKISTTEHKMITAYLDKLNQALKYYFSLKTLPKQTEQLQSLLAPLQIFAEEQKDSPVISELLADLKATLIATKKELLKPMAIEKLPPEILNHVAADNFMSRQALNLAQCSPRLFFGGAGLSFLAKRKRLSELGKFRFTARNHSCFLTIENQLFVWGFNHWKLLDRDNHVPVEFDLTCLQLAPGDGVAQVVAGGHHTILFTQQERYFVWGNNRNGQLGLGNNFERGIKIPVEFDLTRLGLAQGDGIAQVVAGEDHNILLTRQGRCFVWGNNRNGQLGLGDNNNRNIPTEFNLSRLWLAPRDGVAQVVASAYHNILLTRQGRCFIWGYNQAGQLGLGDNFDRYAPTEFDLTRLELDQGDGVAQVVAGAYHNILLTRQGRCFVWGLNGYGQLGLGDNNNRNIPVEFDLTRLGLAPSDGAAHVVAGEYHTLLLTRQGRCFVWGDNRDGELGLEDNSNRNIPVEFDLTRLGLAPGDGVAQVVAGANHTLLLTRQGRCFVWGSNRSGQLGLGSKCLFLSRPKETFYPYLKELKNLWSTLQKEDLVTLASLACEKTIAGQTAYQLIVQRLASENIKTRLLILPLIHASPWHQPAVVTKLLPFASLYEPLVQTLKGKSSEKQQSITHALAKLMNVYNYFIDQYFSLEQITHQDDFVELLKTLSQGNLKDSNDLSQFLEKTPDSVRYIKKFGFTVLDFAFDSSFPYCSAHYFEVCQELLREAKQQPEFLSHLKTGTDILLQGLNVATEADGIAFTFRALLQSKQQLRPTRPGAGLSS